MPVCVSAQVITGKLTDESNQPIPYANVVLLSLSDSAYVAGIVSSEDGTFSLPNPAGAERLLRITMVGYATIYKKCKEGNMGVMQMQPDTHLLSEVVVEGNLPVTRMEDDALVTSVQGTVLSKAGTAEDVLARIPGLQKKKDGFEVLGKGTPLIYINGRKVRDATELDQLSSEEIKSVEVVHNPGARYDATVEAVVRIRTVKRQGDGFGFSLRSSYDQSVNSDFVEQADVNYRHNSLNIFGMIRFDKTSYRQEDIVNQTTYADTIWTQSNNMLTDDNVRQLNGRIGFNYDFNDRHSIGLRYDISKTLHHTSNSIFDSEVKADGELYDVLFTSGTVETDASPSHSLNVYYAGQIGKGNLEWDADYYASHTTKNTLDQEDSQNHDDRTVTSINEVDNKLAATKLSYVRPLWGGSMSVGGEYTYTDRRDDYINPEGYVPTSYSHIREQNMAGYLQYSHPISFGSLGGGQVSAGVRYEHDDFDYYEDGTYMPGQSRTYDNLFPNASLSGQLGKVQLQLSYAAKTQRPNYSQLRNNISYMNRFTWQTGNPQLKPSLTHNLTAVGVWRFFQAMISYRIVRDYILYWGTQVEGQSTTTLINYINHDRLPSLRAMLAASPTIGVWNLNASLFLLKQWFSLDAAGERRTYNNPVFIGSLNNSFTLPAGFLLTADFVYQSRGQVENITLKRPQYTLNFGLRKSFLNDALSVEARANDLLLGSKQEALLYMESAQFTDLSWRDSRSFSITLRYNFNTTKSKYKGTGAGLDARNRMKIAVTQSFHSERYELVKPSIQFHQFIFLASKSKLFRIFQCMHAVAGVYAFNQMNFPMILRRTYKIGTRLVQRHRVKRS